MWILRVRNAFLVLLILASVHFLFIHYLNAYYLQILCLIGINIIMAISLNLISGQTGLFSLGHAGFMAIGAYTSAALTVYGRELFVAALPFLPLEIATHFLFVLALVAGGLCAGVAGLVIGLPALRLKGDYLAIVTLGFGEIVRVIVLNLDFVGGARGFGSIPEYSNFFWIYLFAIVSLILIRNLVHSIKGSALLAIREDEIAAESIGISTSRYKVIAFSVGAFIAGVGGGLFAHLLTYLHTNSFSFLVSIEFIVMVVLGGLGSLTGSILAATLLTILPEVLRIASEWRMIIYSLLLILMMIVRPKGILGNREWGWLRKK